jgi:hypothetical protein
MPEMLLKYCRRRSGIQARSQHTFTGPATPARLDGDLENLCCDGKFMEIATPDAALVERGVAMARY